MSTGTYILVFNLRKESTISIGKLGSIRFPPGIYLYIGSAMGKTSTTLEHRIKRHMVKSTRIHWHIDYLLTHEATKLVKVIGIESEKKNECEISQLIWKNLDVHAPVMGFGASDCRNKCPAHLYRFKNKVSYNLGDLTEVLQTFTHKQNIQHYSLNNES